MKKNSINSKTSGICINLEPFTWIQISVPGTMLPACETTQTLYSELHFVSPGTIFETLIDENAIKILQMIVEIFAYNFNGIKVN